jgi:hypothetical protein
MDTKPSKENGSDKPSSQSADSIAQRSQLRKTLLFAGVFALLAMVFVPGESGGYRLVFDTSGTDIAFVQLLVNVAFAALAGAIVANLSKRAKRVAKWALYVIGACIALIALVSFVGYKIVERPWRNAQDEERYAEGSFRPPYGVNEVAQAKEHFRNAAKNWRLALQFKKAELAEAEANGAAEDMEAARKRAVEKMEVARRREAEEKEEKEKLERLFAQQEDQQKEFDRQWVISAQKVIDAHPELRYQDSLSPHFERLMEILVSNPVYSRRVDGFEYAYKVMTKQLPQPPFELWDNPFYDPFNPSDDLLLWMSEFCISELRTLFSISESEGPCPS